MQHEQLMIDRGLRQHCELAPFSFAGCDDESEVELTRIHVPDEGGLVGSAGGVAFSSPSSCPLLGSGSTSLANLRDGFTLLARACSRARQILSNSSPSSGSMDACYLNALLCVNV